MIKMYFQVKKKKGICHIIIISHESGLCLSNFFYISNIICMYNFLKIYILDFKYTDMYKWRHFAAVCEMIIHDI